MKKGLVDFWHRALYLVLLSVQRWLTYHLTPLYIRSTRLASFALLIDGLLRRFDENGGSLFS